MPGGWPRGWREQFWAQHGADSSWDVVIIGGGISGAGILHEAVRRGLRAVLVEQGDFASGTSSRSSKLVHGGLRYLATGDWKLTLESVRERQQLLQDAPGLVQPQRFLVPIYAHSKPRDWEMRVGLALYDAFAGKRLCYRLDAAAALRLNPALEGTGLLGAYSFQDADTDDARLVLRVLRDAQRAGGHALNYVRVAELLREGARVKGVRVRDRVGNRTCTLRASAVINATGVWAENFTTEAAHKNQLRPLRGSHLIVPQWRFPLGQGISWQHHQDRRNIFVYPWANVTLIGTTDIDHSATLDEEPRHTAEEAHYLLDATRQRFPRLGLSATDVIATYAGVRPVVTSGAADPSDESRESALWVEPGLVTLSGGKLTTFRVAAQQVLDAAAPDLPTMRKAPAGTPILDGTPETAVDNRLSPVAMQRLQELYGGDCSALLQACSRTDLETVGPSPHRWCELRLAAEEEAVTSLSDLLLRRTRIGLLVPQGGASLLPQIRSRVQEPLGWSDARWEDECSHYVAHWQAVHRPPLSAAS